MRPFSILRRALRSAAAGALALLSACSSAPETEADAGTPPSEAPAAQPEATPAPAPSAEPEPIAPTFPAPVADEQVTIPSGAVRVGVRPGSPGRRARYEADLVSISVPTFQIDRLPYPNDPSAPPTFAATREEAAGLCEGQGARLCTELEWERACKGDTLRPYPGGESFDVEQCSIDPLSCASPFGVLGMGVAAFEWTASDVNRGLGSDRYSAVVRGGRATDPAPDHRCGARHALSPDEPSRGVAFRCCTGPVPELAYPEETTLRSFRVLEEIDPTQLRAILTTIPELERFAGDFRLMGPLDIDRALGRGGHTRENMPWTLLEGNVLRWSPIPGEEAWVFAGKGDGSSLIAVVHPLPDGTYVHGASFVFEQESIGLALSWDFGSRHEILWTACAGCAGESGSILFRPEDESILVVQR